MTRRKTQEEQRLERKVERLTAKVEDLQHRIAELSGEADASPITGLHGPKYRCVALLARRSPMAVAYSALFAVASDRFWELIDPKRNLNVQIHRARKLLKGHGIEIETITGVGYQMPPESAARWQALLNSTNQPQEAAA